HRLEHRSGGTAGSQTAQFMLERLGCALHTALQLVDVEFTRGHNTLPSWKRFVEIITLAVRCFTSPSAGDDRTATGAAQDRTYRTRLRDREHDDRQRRLAGKRECGRVHYLVVALGCL